MATGTYSPALNPATNTATGTTSKGFISLTDLLDDREISTGINDLQRDGYFTSMMQELGYTNQVSSKEWYFDTFYNNPKFKVITVSSVGTSGTNTVTFTADTSGYVRAGDTILCPNLKTGYVTSASGTSVTMVTDTGVLTLTNGDKVVVNGNAMGEGSAASAPFRDTLSSIRNNMQIFDEVYQLTDVQGAAWRTVDFNGSRYVTPQAAIAAFQRLQGKEAMTFWSGEISSTLFSNANPVLTDNGLSSTGGGAVQKTRGLDSYVTTYGITPQVNIAGTVTTPDLQDLCDRLIGVKAPINYMMISGGSPKAVLDNFLKGLNSSGVTPIRLQGDNPNISFEATGFDYSGFKFKLMSTPILGNPQTFNYVASGTTKNSIARSIYVLPEGNCPVYGGAPTKYFSMRYMKFDNSFVMNGATNAGGMSTNGRVTEFRDGGLAGIGTTANFTGRLYSQMGAQINLPQLMGKWLVK